MGGKCGRFAEGTLGFGMFAGFAVQEAEMAPKLAGLGEVIGAME